MDKIIEIINDTFEYDQRLRRNNSVPVLVIRNFESVITDIMHTIIDKHGIPLASELGDKAAHNFLILLDHISDKFYFINVFDEQTFADKGYEKRDIALLVDKKLNIQGKKQKFGTLLEAYTDEKGNIRSRPVPIEDERDIDTLREEYGLQSLASYIQKANEVFKKIKRLP